MQKVTLIEGHFVLSMGTVHDSKPVNWPGLFVFYDRRWLVLKPRLHADPFLVWFIQFIHMERHFANGTDVETALQRLFCLAVVCAQCHWRSAWWWCSGWCCSQRAIGIAITVIFKDPIIASGIV
jgi:hypothetical protein